MSFLGVRRTLRPQPPPVRRSWSKTAVRKLGSDQTYGRFRPDMPNVWVKNQNGVSNYPMAYQINAAYMVKAYPLPEYHISLGTNHHSCKNWV